MTGSDRQTDNRQQETRERTTRALEIIATLNILKPLQKSVLIWKNREILKSTGLAAASIGLGIAKFCYAQIVQQPII